MSIVAFATPVVTKTLVFSRRQRRQRSAPRLRHGRSRSRVRWFGWAPSLARGGSWEALLGTVHEKSSFSILSPSSTVTSVEGWQDPFLKGFSCVWLAGRVGRGTRSSCSPQVLLPQPLPPLLSPSQPSLSSRTPPNYWHDKPLALQYVPIRLQNALLRGLLIVNFPRVSLKWLFILPIIISLYLSFLIVFFPSLLLCSRTSVQF